MPLKNCEICGNQFRHFPYEVRRRFCSLQCKGKAPDIKAAIVSANLGKKATDQARLNMSKAHKGKRLGIESPSWKGDNVGYMVMHDWMRETFGTPNECEQCKSTDPLLRYDWANKSGEYKRNREDWVRLCRKCHHKFDNIGEKASKTFLDRKASGKLVLTELPSGKKRWCKQTSL